MAVLDAALEHHGRAADAADRAAAFEIEFAELLDAGWHDSGPLLAARDAQDAADDEAREELDALDALLVDARLLLALIAA